MNNKNTVCHNSFYHYKYYCTYSLNAVVYFILLLGNCGDLSDCESFGNKTKEQKNQNKQNINSSRASLLSSSSHPEIRPFFKVSIVRYLNYSLNTCI